MVAPSTAPSTLDDQHDDQPVDEPVDAQAPTGIPTSRPAHDWRWTIAAGLVVATVRWIFAADRRVIHVIPDESAQLAMARWLGGGPRWNMFDHITFRPGYAVVVGPLWQVTGTAESFVRAALTLNAVVAGLSAMVLTRLVRRWTDLPPLTCAALAAAVAVAPAVISSSAYTWAESLVTLTFLCTMWALQRAVDTGRTTDALLAVVAAAWAMTVHGRSLLLLPVAALVGAVVLLSRRRWAGAGAVVGSAVVLGTASIEFTRWVHDRVWEAAADNNSAEAVIDRLDAPVALVHSLAGQTWYQLVASIGLVGIGAGVVLAALVRPAGRIDRAAAIVITSLTAPLVITSVTFMAGRSRPDQLVYGRYVDAVAWPLVALGGAWVVRRCTGDRNGGLPLLAVGVAATTLLSGVVVAARSGDVLAGDVGLRMMVPGLLPYIGTGEGIPVLRITAVAVAATVAIAVAARRGVVGRTGAAAAILAITVALGWSAVRVHDAQALRLNSWAIGDDVAEIDRIVPPDEPIGAVLVDDAGEERGFQRMRYQLYQLFLPDHAFVWEHHRGGLEHRFVVGPNDWQPFRDAGYEIVWRDPDRPMALWERRGERVPR